MTDNVLKFMCIGGVVLFAVGIALSSALIAVTGVAISIIGFAIAVRLGQKQERENAQRAEDMQKRREERIQSEIDNYLRWINENFEVSNYIGFYKGNGWNRDRVVAIDKENEVIIFGRKVIDFEDIIRAELITSTSQHTTTTGQKENAIGRAVAGGLIAGGAGAIVGAVSAKESSRSTTVVDTHTEGVIIYLSDIDEPVFKYEFDNDEDNKKIYATLLSIISMYN